MKLLILIITLLAGTKCTSSMPAKSPNLIMKEILNELKELQKLEEHITDTTNFTSKHIQTPHDIKNPCKCEETFKEQLKTSVSYLKEILDYDQLYNIFDNLKVVSFKSTTHNCHFKNRTITKATLSSITISLIQDNINFIQHWNTECKKKNRTN